MNTGCPRAPVHDAALQLLQLLDQRFFGNVGPLPATELEAGKFLFFSSVFITVSALYIILFHMLCMIFLLLTYSTYLFHVQPILMFHRITILRFFRFYRDLPYLLNILRILSLHIIDRMQSLRRIACEFYKKT